MSMASSATVLQARSSTSSIPSSSQTAVQHVRPDELPSATLRLRSAAPVERRQIQWADDVVDNEGMGKKSSKVCCIYHKTHAPDDSDSDDSDSSSSDNDSEQEPDLSRAQKAGGDGKKRRSNKDRGHSHGHGKDSDGQPSPNAYERQPKQVKTSGG